MTFVDFLIPYFAFAFLVTLFMAWLFDVRDAPKKRRKKVWVKAVLLSLFWGWLVTPVMLLVCLYCVAVWPLRELDDETE